MSRLSPPQTGDLDLGKAVVKRRDQKGVPSVIGTVTRTLGTGSNAHNSIVWLTIKWCFVIGATTTAALYFRFFWHELDSPDQLSNELKTIWSTFIPVITLALGYLFGRSQE